MKRKALRLMLAVLVAVLPVFVNAEEKAVKIGGTEYDTLKDAVEAVEVCTEEICETTTITVVANHKTSGIKFESGKNLIIDLGGFTVTFKEPTVGSTGTQTQDMQILKNSTIVIKNGKLVSSDTESSKMFIQNYADLTLKDVEIVATNKLSQYALSNNSGTVSIEGTTSIKATKVAFDVYGWYKSYPNGPQVTVDTTGTIEGTIEIAADAGTAAKELSLVIKNINHVGELEIQEGLENNVTIEMEDNNIYKVITPEGETKYVVATEEELVDLPYIQDSITGEEATAELKEFDNMIKEIEAEIKKIEESGEEVPEEITKIKTFFSNLKVLLEGKTGISLHDIVYGSHVGGNWLVEQELKQPSKKVKVTLDIPENLEKVKEGLARKYSVIRIHMTETENTDGTWKYDYEVSELDATDNGDNTVTFETDKFSTYILVYEDVEAETTATTTTTKNPNTFDGISLYMIIATVSLIGLVSVIAYSKKAKNY